MDEQSGETEKEEVMSEVKVSRKWRNLYQNKVDDKTKGWWLCTLSSSCINL